MFVRGVAIYCRSADSGSYFLFANENEMSSQQMSSTVSLPDGVSFPEFSNPLVVFGSRSYHRTGSARENGEQLVSDLEEAGIQFDVIVSGGARGADRAGEVAGVLTDTPVIVFNVNGVDDRHHWYADHSDAHYQVETVSSSDEDDDLPGEGRREHCLIEPSGQSSEQRSAGKTWSRCSEPSTDGPKREDRA